jgi:hypothetical protein
MPRISTFYGIAIVMYFKDHAPLTSMPGTQVKRRSCLSNRVRWFGVIFRRMPSAWSR